MHLSIRTKLTIAFFLVLLPFLFLEFLEIRERTVSGRQAVIDNLTGAAQTGAATMDAFIAEVIRKEQSAAQVVSSERPLSPDDMNAALAQVRVPGAGGTVRVLPVPVVIPKLETLSRSLQPFAQYLAYVNSSGKVVAADPPSMVGQDLSAEPQVQAVVQQGQVWADSGYQPAIAGSATPTPGFSVCLGLRSVPSGGAICAGIPAAAFSEVLPPAPKDGQTVVLDNRGQVLYSSRTANLTDAQRDWSRLAFVNDTTANRAGGAEFVSAEGQPQIGGQTRASSLGWLIGVYRARVAALAPVQATTQRDLLLFGVIVGMTLLLAQWLGAVLARPIVQLTEHARRLSKGDLKHHITINTGDETQTLAETFNAMADSLDHTIFELTEAQQQIAQQSEQLQQLLVRTNAVQEDERRRIAFDIHDGVIQLVIAAGYELQAATRQAGNGNSSESKAKLEAKLERARQLMDQTVGEMRRIVFDLHPTSLDSRGLIPSLEKYCASWQESNGTACRFSVAGDVVDLPSETKVGVYRIVQEALTNTRKHAGASHVDIEALFAPDSLRLSITDDGSGFSLAEAQAVSGHLGLMSMSERARTLGGSLEIQSQPGQGTRLLLSIPLA